MKTSSALVGVSLLCGVLFVGSAAGADDHDSDQKASGSVGLSSPLQFADFAVFESGKGRVKYTNFELAAPGSGVWVPSATSILTFNYEGPNYPHTFALDSFTPLSTESVGFSGTGHFNPDPSYTWNLKGVINEDGVWFQILYTGTQAGCKLYANGEISASGAMSGTWRGTCWTGVNTWSTDPGAAYEVFSYKARVTCSLFDDANNDATFGYTIPNNVPLAGTPVVVKVHDGGFPGAGHDTWAHGVDDAPAACTGGVSNYPITSGNLVVRSDHDWDHDHGFDRDRDRRDDDHRFDR